MYEVLTYAFLLATVALGVTVLMLLREKLRLEGEVAERLAQAGRDAEKWADLSRRASALEADKIRLAGQAQELRGRVAISSEALQRCSQRTAQLEARVADLAGWQVVGDAHEAASRIVQAAREKANVVENQASVTREAASQTLKDATVQAGEIVSSAKVKAEEIAGDAYAMMRDIGRLESTAKALRNKVEGYGDEYLVPGHSLLDDLAEEFSFTEAGAELKKVRERTRLMVRNGIAATCGYVEAGRKETAIQFVTDAFNGKVDSILARVRDDNAGTLAQEMRDAYTLVNDNGRAFREARILPEYLASRLEELKWAAIAHQLRLEERDEQRRIKEQIREEEKAKRDYERAIREAAKEEDVLRKAMEKAQAQIAVVSAEQRERYEKQLAELTDKLKEAEEKNQRALSMAQQTKRGHVYIISNVGSFGENVYKIGLTRRLDPLDRVRELGDSSVPFEFDVHAMIFSEDAPALEHQLHRHFLLMQMNKVNHRKEFFKVDLSHIKEEVEKFGLSTKWTLAAKAEEYRESLAIEQVIAQDPKKREAWVNRQLVLDQNSTVPDDAGEDDTGVSERGRTASLPQTN